MSRNKCKIGARPGVNPGGMSPARAPRQGWDEVFAAMAERGDDAPLMPDDLEQGFDWDEWVW